MAEFINTIDVLGDDAVVDSFIERNITEFKDNVITSVAGSAFRKCANLVVVELPNVETLGTFPFEGCSALKRAHLPKWKATTDVNSVFSGCYALTDVHVPLVQYVGQYMFYQCQQLEKVDLPSANHIHSVAFCYAYRLKAVILRNEQICTLYNSGVFSPSGITSGTGHIYVPRALVDSYKAATNWSAYATQIRALEDYTVDGTITGDLDESKI